MKRFKLNFGVVALVLGLTTALAASAFTPAASEDIYVLTSEGYQLKSLVEDQGACVNLAYQHCEFIKNSSEQYEPAPGDMNRVWKSLSKEKSG